MEVTNNKGVEPAMEWLLAHAGDMNATTERVIADSTNTNEQSTIDGGVGSEIAADGVSGGSDSASTSGEVKSLKCEEW